ncbi:MAG TPA: polyphosphate kinase 1 [Acidimicrobiales bacterium]|nr:polyphosphate kinase 1 [Acidimicrobiales bacterium]
MMLQANTETDGDLVWRVGGEDHNSSRFLNREMSWLAFNGRVLALADDERIPLLDRLRFVAIFGDNLDEFFQVRVAGLSDQVEAGVTSQTADGRSPQEQLDAIASITRQQTERAQALWHDELRPRVERAGVTIVDWPALDLADQQHFTELFHTRIFPTLTPLAVDPGHPFPYISDLSLNLAVVLTDPHDGRRLFARVKVPPPLPRFLRSPDEDRFVPVEQVIAAQLEQLFPGMRIAEHHLFRVTRNADLTVKEGEADDLLAAVETELRRRRFGRAIRLEVTPSMSHEVRALLIRELDLEADQVYECESLVDLTGLFSIVDLPRADLHDPPFTPVTHPLLANPDVDIFAALRNNDVLVHHPYHSFATSVVEFIQRAADDPHVLAIKITIYRTSGDSPIIDALIAAAEQGKQVAVLVELKARFDEKANIEWARQLEQAGVHVAYGLVGYKIHTKVCLVIRDEPDGIRRYVHIGTGNYDQRTATRYEDLGLLTTDPRVGADATNLFNFLTGYGRGIGYDTLLVAPDSLRKSLGEYIDNEIRCGDGRIIMKMNSLVDPTLIDRLYLASSAGVRIDLIARGICCLRPGVRGMSENIRVRSIVGRYLEHSRIYAFANGDGPGKPVYLIGSADLMPRNLDRRVEVLVRVEDEELQAELQEILDVLLADDHLSWELDSAGVWSRTQRPQGLDSQQWFQRAASGSVAG